LYFQYKEGGAVPSSRSNEMMGIQVANNKESQMVMYLHLDKGKWYILSEPKSKGLVKKEYLPIGNRLVYPKKWDRKKAADILLNHLIKDNTLMKELAEERLEYLHKLTNEVKDWK
tara:strand:+ start:589 stop:933 length:345 start_codon:yes stop_codon:yes gene_type:complete